MKKKFVRPASGFDVEAKIERIMASAMPESQKAEYVEMLRPAVKEKQDCVPFSVYAIVKGIPDYISKSMQSFPPAKGTKLASLKEWDQVYKDF